MLGWLRPTADLIHPQVLLGLASMSHDVRRGLK
jgi:hypothetical protein